MNPNNWNENVRKSLDYLVGAAAGLIVAFGIVTTNDTQNGAIVLFYGAFRTFFWSVFPGYNTAAK